MNKEQKEVLQAQLNNEKQTINELKEVYETALKDCNEKIKELSMRKDLENVQSIIYQKQYQQAIKGQLEGILEQLHGDSFSTVSDYLARCYEDGFIGTMYDIAGQGIPLIASIDQAQAIQAIQTDSKLSKSLYDRLGEDVNELKKSVRQEVSRGIANGSSWVAVADNLAQNFKNTPFSKAYNNSIRIARTEGHRISIQSAMDAQEKAKKKGADVVKQWDATLDGRTRETHRLLDGQIRELDEDFEVMGKRASAPSQFGDPAEDCNCRCALLQRARWALDDDELAALKEKAAYHGLLVDDSKEYGHEKAKDFSDYKKKYSAAAKIEEQYNNAVKIEPMITKAMKEISDNTGADLYGLENRIKPKESYLEKMNKHGYDYEAKDIVRYTFGTENQEEYVSKVGAVIDNLKEMGYNVNEIKNYWLDGENPYNGINSTVVEHGGQKFEVQFHTKESFEAKEKMHSLYEEQRKITDPFSSEYIELTDKMFDIADGITVPDGVRGI